MPYALSNLVDGEVPAARSIARASDAQAGEVVVQDADMHDGWVWDAANNTLRPPQSADLLKFAKRSKRTEMEHAFASNMEQIMPIWLALARMAKNLSSTDPRFAKVSSGHDQLQTIYTQIQNGGTPDAVNNITWNQVS